MAELLIGAGVFQSLGDMYLQVERSQNQDARLRGDKARFRMLRRVGDALLLRRELPGKEDLEATLRYVLPHVCSEEWNPRLSDFRGLGAWWCVRRRFCSYGKDPEFEPLKPLVGFALSLCDEEKSLLIELRKLSPEQSIKWLIQLWRDRLKVPEDICNPALDDLELLQNKETAKEWQKKHEALFYSVLIHQLLYIGALIEEELYYGESERPKPGGLEKIIPRIDSRNNYSGAQKRLIDTILERVGETSIRKFAYECAPEPTESESQRGIDRAEKAESIRRKITRWRNGDGLTANSLNEILVPMAKVGVYEEMVIGAKLIDAVHRELRMSYGDHWIVEQFSRYSLIKSELQLRFADYIRSCE